MTLAVPGCLYLDTSAVLSAVLENGTTPDLEGRIAAAPALVTSRLSLVESSRVLHPLRLLRQTSEAKLADAQRENNRSVGQVRALGGNPIGPAKWLARLPQRDHYVRWMPFISPPSS